MRVNIVRRQEMTWQKKADAMWRIVIRQTGKCERCGEIGVPGKGKDTWLNLESHHIITRGHIPYRHMVENGVCLCHKCHKFSPYSAHNDRSSFLDWLRLYRPGIWGWYREHTGAELKEIGNSPVCVFHPIRIDHMGDKKEYEMLKEIAEKYTECQEN